MKIQIPLINPAVSNQQGLRVEKVNHFFGTRRVLKNVSFEANHGEVCAILGPNGAGKTTLMRIITGYFLPFEGRVWLGSQDLTQDPLRAKSLIGYLPEHFPVYPNLTVQEFLSWCLSMRDFGGDKKKEIEWVLSLVNFDERTNARVDKLSRGMRQRIGLAQALLAEPAYLILDEPTSGLDPAQIRAMRELIIKLKKDRTVILSTHILAEAAQISDRIIILSDGQVISSGRPKELEDAYLGNETVYRAGFTGELPKIEEVLKGLPNLIAYELVSSLQDQHRVELRVEPKISEKIFLKNLVQARLRPFEYFRKELKLEDIFLKAVTREN